MITVFEDYNYDKYQFEVGDIVKVKKISRDTFSYGFQDVVESLVGIPCTIISIEEDDDYCFIEYDKKIPKLESLVWGIINSHGTFGNFTEEEVEFFESHKNKNIFYIDVMYLDLIEKRSEFEDSNMEEWLEEALDNNGNELKVGDWVKLGNPGFGWGDELKYQIARIKSIGRYDLGYDIILDSRSNPKLEGEQCAGEDTGITGCGSVNMRLATPEEITNHCARYKIPNYDEPEESNFEEWREE